MKERMTLRRKSNHDVKTVGRTQSLDLFMECNDDDLSPAQVSAFKSAEKEYQDVLKKISALKAKDIKTIQGNAASESVDSGRRPTPIAATSQSQVVTAVTSSGQNYVGIPRLTLPLAKSQLIIQNKISAPAPAASYKLLLDARTGLIIGTLPSDTQTIIAGCGTTATPQTVALAPVQTTAPVIVDKTISLPGNLPGNMKPAHELSRNTSGNSVLRQDQTENKTEGKTRIVEIQKTSPANVRDVPVTRSRSSESQINAALNDTENKSQEKLLSATEGQQRLPSQYPSLTIKAVPQRSASPSVIQCKKLELDKTLKDVLQENTSDLVKWMFEHGLFHIEQYCLVHRSTKMQLVFDVRQEKDHSGGYKWQCGTCTRVLPIQHRSFFENLGYGLLTMLQIIYHWACSEDVQKVLQETKVSACFLRSVYSLLRSICSCKSKNLSKLGGIDSRPVEVYLCLLNDTCMYASQLYLGCIFERISGMVSLRAFTTKSDSLIEEFIGHYVAQSSIINTDKSLKLQSSFLTKHNYKHISTNGSVILNAKAYIEERVLPMFGNVIKQLQMETIQSFLSELMWREKFATNPYNAFNNILLHIKQHYGTGTSMLKANQPLQMPVVSIMSLSSGSVTTVKASSKSNSENSAEQTVESSQSETSHGLISLNDYYYAWQEGNGSWKTTEKEPQGYKFKCYVCKKMFDNNIKVMRHLYAHIESSKQKNLDLSDVTQCKHCFREFETPYIMQCHVEDVHLKESKSLTCQICDRAFHDKRTLINHMHQIHVAAEMPYACEVCNYRCSMYRKLINHFHQEHSGTNFIQCHYCLKVFSVRFSSVQQLGLTNNFWTHIYKHQTKSLSRKCTACCLTFFGQNEMKNHRQNDHVSFWRKSGVCKFPSSDKNSDIFMYEPSSKKIRNPRCRLPKSAASTVTKQNTSFINYDQDRSFRFNDTEGMRCIECKGSMEIPDHFLKCLCCSKCRYVTNCSKAFTEHMILSHSSGRKKKLTCNPIRLPAEMHCVCGYSHTLGNNMASHLSLCGKRSCYPSEECAENAILSTSISHGDNSTCENLNVSFEETINEINLNKRPRKCELQDDNPSMLNILGLMRNPKKRRHHLHNQPNDDSTSEGSLGKERTKSLRE